MGEYEMNGEACWFVEHSRMQVSRIVSFTFKLNRFSKKMGSQ